MPERIGAYEIRSLLGRGGMGVVYLAYEPTLDRLLAVKVLNVHGEATQRRFLKEARFAARVQHPHIVGIYAVGEHEGRPYIAMEYIAGETLAAVLRRNEPTGLGRRVQWLSELASGLEFAHRNGVVHRDVKPANLIISRDSGLLRLVDFGIARDYQAEATSVAALGTPQYMSPEQITGGLVDARSDIFAFGLVAYELLTGRRAFEGSNPLEVTTNIVETEPVPITNRVAGVPEDLVRLVHHCLAKAPEQRPSDMVQVLARLRRITRKLEAATDDATIVRTSPRTPPGLATTMAATPDEPGDTPRPETSPADRERRAHQLATHLARARAALEAGQLDAAVQAAAHAALVDDQDPAVRELFERIEDRRRARELSTRLADVEALILDGRSPEALQRLDAIRPALAAPADRARFDLLLQQAQRLHQAERCASDVRAALARGDDRAAQARIDGESAEVRSHVIVMALLSDVAAARGAREHAEAEARLRIEQERRAAEARARTPQPQRAPRAQAEEPLAAQARIHPEQARPRTDARAAPERPPRGPTTHKRPRLTRLVAGVGVALLGVLAGAWYYSRAGDTIVGTAQSLEPRQTELSRPAEPPKSPPRAGAAERQSPQPSSTPAEGTNAALAAQVRSAAARGDVRRAASLLRGMALHDPARPLLEREVLHRAQRLASDARQAALTRGATTAGAFVAASALMRRADDRFASDPIDAIALYGAAQQSFDAASAPAQVGPSERPGPAAPDAGRPPVAADSPRSGSSTAAEGAAGGTGEALGAARPSPEAATRAAASDSAILAQLDAFEHAYETRRVAALRQVWPTMPEPWARAFQASVRNVSSVDWSFGDRRVAVNGPSSTVTSRVRIQRSGRSAGRLPDTEATYRFELRQRSGRWVISGVTTTR